MSTTRTTTPLPNACQFDCREAQCSDCEHWPQRQQFDIEQQAENTTNQVWSEFKPDADLTPGARCECCSTDVGVAWIAGAGEYLCSRHQDDY